jgi:hypothetical protein
MNVERADPTRSDLGRVNATGRLHRDRREAAQHDGSGRIDIEPPARPFQLANSTVVVSLCSLGFFARIERDDRTEYGWLAPGTLDALAEVANPG